MFEGPFDSAPRVRLSRRLFLAGLAAAALRSNRAFSADISASESQAKAAFVFSFPKYIEWPATAFADEASPLGICVAGDYEMGRELAKIADGKRIAGRKVLVHDEYPGDLSDCRVFFVSAARKSSAPQLLRGFRNQPTLTVGDFENFLDLGGMIGLAMKGSRIRFDVNLPAAEAAGLVLSAKLLALAETVRGRSSK